MYILLKIDNYIGDGGLQCLCENISNLYKLETLNLSGNDISDNGIEIFVNNITQLKYLKYLKIMSIIFIFIDNNINNFGGRLLCDNLLKLINLKELYISCILFYIKQII